MIITYTCITIVNVWKKKAKAAFLWFHMRNLSLAGYNCSGGASCMACSFITHWTYCVMNSQDTCIKIETFMGKPSIVAGFFCCTCFSMGNLGVQVSVRPSVRPSINIYPGCPVSASPLTVLYWSFWNFTCVFVMVWGCACGLDIIGRLFFVTFSALWT